MREWKYTVGHAGHECHYGTDGRCILAVRDERGRLIDSRGRVVDSRSGRPLPNGRSHRSWRWTARAYMIQEVLVVLFLISMFFLLLWLTAPAQ